MRQLTAELLANYRKRTFCLLPDLRVRTIEEAVAFVNERGFTFFWPISGINLPNLWMAVAGDRPVASAHDDPAQITWNWKDSLLGERKWYYAKVLRKKSTMISFELVPFFYALSNNYGDFEADYLTLYEQGRLTLEAKRVYEAILNNGPMDTVQLRRITQLSAPASESRFNQALASLQSDFKILPVGVTNSGAWKYAFAYDITARHYPDIPAAAHHIAEQVAFQNLLLAYVRMLGAVEYTDIRKLFGWDMSNIYSAVDKLIQNRELYIISKPAQETGNLLVIPDLLFEGH